MIHADLKPENVFLGYEELYGSPEHTGGLANGMFPTIKIGDFGCAQFATDAGPNNHEDFWGIGTNGFQPPVSGEKRPTG